MKLYNIFQCLFLKKLRSFKHHIGYKKVHKSPVGTTISLVIFRDFLMFYQVFLSPQVKWCAIITFKYGLYQLPDELVNNVIFHIKTRVGLTYLVGHCLWKPLLDSNSPQTPPNPTHLTPLVTLRPLTLP